MSKIDGVGYGHHYQLGVLLFFIDAFGENSHPSCTGGWQKSSSSKKAVRAKVNSMYYESLKTKAKQLYRERLS